MNDDVYFSQWKYKAKSLTDAYPSFVVNLEERMKPIIINYYDRNNDKWKKLILASNLNCLQIDNKLLSLPRFNELKRIIDHKPPDDETMPTVPFDVLSDDHQELYLGAPCARMEVTDEIDFFPMYRNLIINQFCIECGNETERMSNGKYAKLDHKTLRKVILKTTDDKTKDDEYTHNRVYCNNCGIWMHEWCQQNQPLSEAPPLLKDATSIAWYPVGWCEYCIMQRMLFVYYSYIICILFIYYSYIICILFIYYLFRFINNNHRTTG